MFPDAQFGDLLPETVRSFWHGGPLPPLARACLRSFCRHGHRVELHSYRPLDVPDGVVLADASRILPAARLEPFTQSIAVFADLFRYEMLRVLGGWWVDTDVYCLTPVLPPEPRAWAPEDHDTLNNAILKFPAGDPTCETLVRLSRERASPTGRWGVTGPLLLAEVVADTTDDHHAGTRADFYPIHWLEAHYAWLPERRAEFVERIAGASFVHLWMKALTDCGIDLHRAPPRGSWLDAACAGESWPRRNFPWSEWRTRRAIARYHGAAWVRERLRAVVERRS